MTGDGLVRLRPFYCPVGFRGFEWLNGLNMLLGVGIDPGFLPYEKCGWFCMAFDFDRGFERGVSLTSIDLALRQLSYCFVLSYSTSSK